jgi:hypothetical protein
MDYKEFLERVINDGIEAVKTDYKEGDNRREGSIQGFEDCRGKPPQELLALLTEARKKAEEVYWEAQEGDKAAVDRYWHYQSRALEIEWVCNSMSAAFANSNMAPLIPPTCRGALNAARILGVKG